MIELKPVKSSNLAAVGHDPATQILAVKFTGSDKVHHYRDVPAEVVAAMDSAPSIGSYFAKNVRDKFPHEVVDGSALPASSMSTVEAAALGALKLFRRPATVPELSSALDEAYSDASLYAALAGLAKVHRAVTKQSESVHLSGATVTRVTWLAAESAI